MINIISNNLAGLRKVDIVPKKDGDYLDKRIKITNNRERPIFIISGFQIWGNNDDCKKDITKFSNANISNNRIPYQKIFNI